MSVTSGFFNSVNGDRRYSAEQMSSLFDGIINDGVFASIGTAFEVKAKSGKTVTVGLGRAWFNSIWVDNDAILSITANDAEILLSRYDAIVIEINHTSAVRAGTIKYIKGTASSNPQKPTMANTNEIHQYPLAYIYRPAGSTEITQSNITNCVGTSSCPYITGILQVQNIDKNVAQWEAQFNEWFDRMQDQLSEDAVGNLQRQIDELEGSVIPNNDILILTDTSNGFRGKGWYRISKLVGDDVAAARGAWCNSAEIIIKRGYNAITSEYHRILLASRYYNSLLFPFESYCNGHNAHLFTKIRQVLDSSNAITYLELYYDSDSSNGAVIQLLNTRTIGGTHWEAMTVTPTSEDLGSLELLAQMDIPLNCKPATNLDLEKYLVASNNGYIEDALRVDFENPNGVYNRPYIVNVNKAIDCPGYLYFGVREVLWYATNYVVVRITGIAADYKTTRIWTNTYFDGVWRGWSMSVVSDDLANYLPLSGGELTNNLEIGDGSDADRKVIVRSNTRRISLLADGSSSGSGAGLYDLLNGWIVKSSADGKNVNIPAHLNVGGITSDGYIYQNSFNNQVIIGAQNETYCHFTSSNHPFYFDKDILVNGSKVLTEAGGTLTGELFIDDKRVAVCDLPAIIMTVNGFEAKYGKDSIPSDWGMVTMQGYSRPGTYSGDTYYHVVNHEGKSFNGRQINNATTIAWNRNLTTDDFVVTGSVNEATLTINLD